VREGFKRRVQNAFFSPRQQLRGKLRAQGGAGEYLTTCTAEATNNGAVQLVGSRACLPACLPARQPTG
jgi:hypothetical protein